MKTLSRLIKTTLQRITRNPYHSIGAIFVMFLTFFVGGIFVMLSLWSTAALKDFESRPQIDAFFKDDATQEEIDALEKKLKETGSIANIKFISKEEALEIYKERNKDDPLLTEFVTADILPASFQIATKNIDDLEMVANIVASEEIVENVVFQRDLIETLSTWTKTIRNVGVAVVVFLLLTSLLTTLIVISLNISLHKDEIETMRLVGATKGYIRTPFIFEGIFYGLVAAFFATIGVWMVVYWVTPFLREFFATDFSISFTLAFIAPQTVFPFNPITFTYLFIAEATAGIITGALGSFIATRKYLKI